MPAACEKEIAIGRNTVIGLPNEWTLYSVYFKEFLKNTKYWLTPRSTPSMIPIAESGPDARNILQDQKERSVKKATLSARNAAWISRG